MSIILTFILFLSCFTKGICYTITDSFQLCTHNKYSEKIDLRKQCHYPNINLNDFNKVNVSILEKRYNLIDGFGYMCSKTKIIVTTHKNWKNQKLSVRTQTIEKLSRSECLALYISKNCERQLMTGTNNYYKSILEPEVEYSYFGPPRIFVSYHRHVFKRHIVGSSLTQPLYLNADSRCWPEDLYCQIQENILIWENDIIHKCPFFFIRQIPATIIGNIIIGDNLLFQITNKQQACDVHIMSTTEGIYISVDLRAS
jgi:hypothetical protein